MKYFMSLATVAALALAMPSLHHAQDKGKAEVKCPVAGRAIDKNAFVEFNGGKVYFCCMNCPEKFKATPEKFASKANHQLYATKQAKLVKCPLTGRELNTDTKITVQGVPVCFCCNMCKGKAEDAEGQKQIDLIFNTTAFKKGFEVKK